MRIVKLLNATINGVYKAAPSCKPDVSGILKNTVSDADPTAELLNTFAIFRRPATETELTLATTELGLPADGVYRRYTRIATSASGRQFTIYPAENVHRYKPRAERCIAALRRDFASAIRDETAAFQRSANHALEQVIHDEWAGPAPKPAEGLFMFTYSPEDGYGSGGGGADVADVRARGMFGSSGSFASGAVATVSGLVPDGVAKVRLRFGTKRAPEPAMPAPGETAPAAAPKPKPYAHVLERTVTVRDNVISLRVRRSGIDALNAKMTWLAADGSVVREVGVR